MIDDKEREDTSMSNQRPPAPKDAPVEQVKDLSSSSPNFGEFIRQERSRKFPGLSITQFAQHELQISGPYLSSIETGRVAPPSIDVILRMASVLHVDRMELLKRAGYSDQEKLKAAREKTPPESDEFIKAIKLIAKDYGYGYTFTTKDFVSVVLGRYLMSGSDLGKNDLLAFIESVAEVVKKPRRFYSVDIREYASIGSDALDVLEKARMLGHSIPDKNRRRRGSLCDPRDVTAPSTEMLADVEGEILSKEQGMEPKH